MLSFNQIKIGIIAISLAVAAMVWAPITDAAPKDKPNTTNGGDGGSNDVDVINDDVSPSPTSSAKMEMEKNQSEIDQFIGNTQKRLSDIDSLLSE